MSLFAVFYTYAEGSDDKRDEHRPAHRAFLRELHEAGKLKVCGPWGPEEAPGGMLIFEGDTAAQIGDLLDDDPFHQVGVVADRSIKSWGIVIGSVG
ncbi:MAG TPA: YciI family protein [Pseudonocardia sp.]|nr:YciI family protein [Pseudonocardia sp.]